MGNILGTTPSNIPFIEIPFRDEEHMGFILQKEIYAGIFIGETHYTASRNTLLTGKIIKNNTLIYIKKRIKKVGRPLLLYAEIPSMKDDNNNSFVLDVSPLFLKKDPLEPNLRFIKSTLNSLNKSLSIPIRVWKDNDYVYSNSY